MPVKHLSHSSVNTYLMCPKSWQFRYIEKPRVKVAVALPFGTAIHKAIQTYIAAKVEGHDVKPLVDLWPDCWHGALHEPRNADNIKWDRTYDHYTNLGASMLSAPDVVAAIEGIEPLLVPIPGEPLPYVEYRVEFRVPGVPVPVIGYIDMIEVDGVPVDFKTAARKWSKGKEHTEMQTDFYLLGLNYEGYDLNPNLQFRYYIFTKTKSPTCQILDTVRCWGDLLFTMQTIKEVWEAIQAGAFPPNPTTWKCGPKWCEYYPLCRGKEL